MKTVLRANNSKQITVQLVWEGHTIKALRVNPVNNLDTLNPRFSTRGNKYSEFQHQKVFHSLGKCANMQISNDPPTHTHTHDMQKQQKKSVLRCQLKTSTQKLKQKRSSQSVSLLSTVNPDSSRAQFTPQPDTTYDVHLLF